MDKLTNRKTNSKNTNGQFIERTIGKTIECTMQPIKYASLQSIDDATNR